MTQIALFATEHYYAKYEFAAPHMLSASDCETISVAELLSLADVPLDGFGEVRLGYTESPGSPALREAVASEYESASADDVIVLNSPVEGIYITMRSLLGPGDEAVVLLPAYDALKNIPEHVSGWVRPWRLLPTQSGWQMDLGALKRLVSRRTKLIVVNFPHNPTGFLPAISQFRDLIAIARQCGAWLFCDEMYRGLEFGAAPRLRSAIDLYERAIVLAGLSKTHGLPGLRAGWLLIKDQKVRGELLNWKYYTSICPPAPVEYLSLAALRVADLLAERSRTLIVENLAVAQSFFERHSDFFTWRPPQAGSVALAGIGVTSAAEYCRRLAEEEGIVLLPAAFMGQEDRFVRFGLGRKSFPEALSAYEEVLGKDSITQE